MSIEKPRKTEEIFISKYQSLGLLAEALGSHHPEPYSILPSVVLLYVKLRPDKWHQLIFLKSGA